MVCLDSTLQRESQIVTLPSHHELWVNHISAAANRLAGTDKNVSENRISRIPSSEVGVVSSCVSWVLLFPRQNLDTGNQAR